MIQPLLMRSETPHLLLNGVPLMVALEGALYCEASGALLVADLHLEKGSSAATRGLFLPPYDTASTLARLGRLVHRLAPKLVVCLGDSFHDRGGPSRMAEIDRAALRALQRGRDWVWIAGNHDPEAPPPALGGEATPEMRLGALTLRHEPLPGAEPGEVAGHLHPVAIVRAGAGRARRPCVASDGLRAILPAFGAYTGGLPLGDPAFADLFDHKRLVAFVLGETAVHPIPGRRCLG